MNERIKELADKAELLAACMTPQGLECFGNFKEQFALLLVKECANKVDWILTEGGRTQGDLIREHFGIKRELD